LLLQRAALLSCGVLTRPMRRRNERRANSLKHRFVKQSLKISTKNCAKIQHRAVGMKWKWRRPRRLLWRWRCCIYGICRRHLVGLLRCCSITP